MPSRPRLLSILSVATLMAVAGCSMLMPTVRANGFTFSVRSIEQGGSTTNLGTLNIGNIVNQQLPVDYLGPGSWQLRYNSAAGYVFVKWESTGSITFGDPNAISTTVNVQGPGTITAVYRAQASVGGIVIPTNALTVIAPYLAMIGLVATAAVAVKKRRN